MSNIEEVLKEKEIYVTTTRGDSMEPMLVEGRDKVVIVPPRFPLKKYDVPVYRKMGHFTMHRIVRVSKSGYVICGDNRATLEKNVTDSDIIGVLAGFYQGDKYIDAKDKEFLKYGKNAVNTLPLRLFKSLMKRGIKKVKRMLKR